MFSRVIILTLIVVSTTVSGDDQRNSVANIRSNRTARILDGELTQISEVPHQVQLIVKESASGNFKMLCGGSILSPRLILTAANCVEQYVKKDQLTYLKVVTGSNRATILKSTSKRYDVAEVKIHREYRKNFIGYANDLAVLILDGTLNFNQKGYTAQPVSLAKRSSIGSKAILSGFGGTPEPAEYLRSVELPIISNGQCLEVFGKNGTIEEKPLIDESMICAGTFDNNKAGAGGDSGSALVFKEDGKFIQVGVYSWTSIFERPDTFPKKLSVGVFASIPHAHNWIEKIISERG